MDTTTAKHEQMKLEQQIRDLVSAYEKATRMTVRYIDLLHINTYGGTSELVAVACDVRL